MSHQLPEDQKAVYDHIAYDELPDSTTSARTASASAYTPTPADLTEATSSEPDVFAIADTKLCAHIPGVFFVCGATRRCNMNLVDCKDAPRLMILHEAYTKYIAPQS